MNKNVKSVIVGLLKEKEIVSSWGISNILIEGSSIHFQVEGFIYRGSIRIICDKPYCVIEFDGGKAIQCLMNELTNVLDTAIEKDGNYLSNLEKWLSSQV